MNDIVTLNGTDEDVSIESSEDDKCWSCGYSGGELSRVVLENSIRQKKEHVICGLCFEAPFVLDAYLNPWLYETNVKELMVTMTFMTNKVLDAMKEKGESNERKIT